MTPVITPPMVSTEFFLSWSHLSGDARKAIDSYVPSESNGNYQTGLAHFLGSQDNQWNKINGSTIKLSVTEIFQNMLTMTGDMISNFETKAKTDNWFTGENGLDKLIASQPEPIAWPPRPSLRRCCR